MASLSLAKGVITADAYRHTYLSLLRDGNAIPQGLKPNVLCGRLFPGLLNSSQSARLVQEPVTV